MLTDIPFDEFAGDSFWEVTGALFRALLPETLMEGVTKISVLLLVLVFAAGIIQCLFGFRLRKIWTGAVCAMICGLTGAAVAVYLELGAGAAAGIGAGAAVLGGLFGYFVWFAGLFLRVLLTVSFGGFAVGMLLELDALGLIIALAAGLIAAILTVTFWKVMLIVYTSVIGGLAASSCFFELLLPKADWYQQLIAGGVLAAAGMAVQIAAERHRAAKCRAEENGPAENIFPEDGMTEAGFAGTGEANGTQEAFPAGAAETAAAAEQSASDQGGMSSENRFENDFHSLEGGGTFGEQHAQFAAHGGDASVPGNDADGMPAGLPANGAENGAAGAEPQKCFCTACGAGFPRGTKFCMKCGQKLG